MNKASRVVISLCLIVSFCIIYILISAYKAQSQESETDALIKHVLEEKYATITKDALEQEIEGAYGEFSATLRKISTPEGLSEIKKVSQSLHGNYAKYRKEMRSVEFRSSTDPLKYVNLTSRVITLETRLIENVLKLAGTKPEIDKILLSEIIDTWSTWISQESLYTSYVIDGHFLE